MSESDKHDNSQSAQVAQQVKNDSELERKIDAVCQRAEQDLLALDESLKKSIGSHELQKQEIVKGLCGQLESLGYPTHRIAARIVTYFDGLKSEDGVKLIDRSYVWRVVEDKYKDMERSIKTKAGIAQKRGPRQSAASDDASTDHGTDGAVPAGQLGSKSPDYALAVHALLEVLRKMAKAMTPTEDGKGYVVAKEHADELMHVMQRMGVKI